MEQKEKILNIILQSIYKGCWMEVQYQNKKDIKKIFWIHIKYINFEAETFTCISASLDDGKLNCKKITLSIDRFISAKLLENTCFEDNKRIIDFLNENIIETKKMFPSFDYGNVLNYLIDCAKKDSSEKIINSEMALGIDTDELKKHKEYKLNDSQFKEIKKIARDCDELAINILSIAYDNNKKFFLAYRYAKFNVEKRTLVMEEKTRPNKSLTSDKNITQFIYEDEEYLLDDFDNNIEEIISLIRQRIKGKNYDIMQRSEIISIKNHFPLPIEEQLDGIRDMYIKDEVTHPIKSFFGEIESSRSKKVNSFCFVQNLNFSQIVSVFYGMKDHVSFVQGPPGTGKTSMVVNLVTSLFFNDKKVLITTNNNQPMKDLTKKLNEISHYKDEAIELPICRLSAQDKMKDTIIHMNHLYNKYKNASVNDYILEQNSSKQKHLLKDEVETLNKLAEYLEKNKRRLELLKFFEGTKDKSQLVSFETLFKANLKEEVSPIKNEKEFIKNITINENLVKSFLYFNSAKYLQKLDLHRYKVLKNIIDIDINDTDAVQESIQELINLLSDDDGVKLLLDVFPIVLSTNISSSKLGSPKPHFDYCIIDEAAQCNITYSLISIIRGENLVLVGDPQQLKPVVTLSKIDNEELKEKYQINDIYDYLSQSIYSTMRSTSPYNKETLLNIHYRCNEKIIGFCNKRYYKNKLQIETLSNENKPLEFAPVEDNKNLRNSNESFSEVKKIIEVLRRNELKNKSIGIITPFVVQRKLLEKELHNEEFKNMDITIGTIHTFQGNEKDVVIFSTAISNNTRLGAYRWLKNNKELINVAMSRAKNKFIVVSNENALEKLHAKTMSKVNKDDKDEIYDLYNYMKTDGTAVVIPNALKCEVLDTEEEGTLYDQQRRKDLMLILSVLRLDSKIQENVPFKKIIGEDINDKFDFVVQSKYDKLAVQVIKASSYNYDFSSIKQKCRAKGYQYLDIKTDDARSYFLLKEAVKDAIKN